MSTPNSRRWKIKLFGHFGVSNFGNEVTFEAMLGHLRRLLPDAELSCVCSAPDVVSANYEIPALPISWIVVPHGSLRNPVVRMLRRLFIGIPSEIYRWFQIWATLRGTDMLIVVGTGLLTDAFGIHSWGPYSVFRWSVVARLCGCRLMFVSVGAGPLERRSAQFFVKSALSLAKFRSYRDQATVEYLKTIGFRRRKEDRVYPDLAFSLPSASSNRDGVKGGRRVVGLGLMLYDGMYAIEKTTRAHYAAYLETLVVFANWLLERDYDIRLLTGDHGDDLAVQEFISLFRDRSSKDKENRIVADPIASPRDLMSQLAVTDFVVATRFHNAVLALFLNKPTISISFHHKCSALMNEAGLSEYCEDIKRVNAQKLIEQFCLLEANASAVKLLLRERTAEYREALDEQYRLILKGMLPDNPAEEATLRSVPRSLEGPGGISQPYRGTEG